MKKKDDINAADFDCSICFENYNCKKEIKLNCSHVFCKECIFTTIEMNIEKNIVPPCPLCRRNISKVSIKDEFDYLDYIEQFQDLVCRWGGVADAAETLNYEVDEGDARVVEGGVEE